MKLQFFFSFLLLLLIQAEACAQVQDKAKLDRFFDVLAEKKKGMGAIVIAKDGKELYNRSIGYGRIKGTELSTLASDSRFRIASITKMFTTVLILQLIEEGKLTFNDKLAKFYPEIPNSESITIEHLLSHRSGIPNVRRNRDGRNDVNTMPMSREEMLAIIVAGRPEFEPGTKHAYSNTAYLVLGLILEKITGKSYAELLEQRITGPLALNNTYFATGNIDPAKKEALTYMNIGGSWKEVPETHPSILFSAGAIISTPRDLVRFIQLLFDGKIVSNENLERMKTIRDGDGLGMEPFDFAGKTFYGHTGGGDNYGAWLAYLPEEKLAVAYTTNAKVFPVHDIVSGAIDIYFNRPFDIPTFETITVSPDVLDRYVGVYSTDNAPVRFTISRQDTILYIQANNETPAPLEALAPDKFQIAGAITVEFDVAKSQLTIIRPQGQRTFTKVK